MTIARSYSAAEAIELNVVDIIAADLADLLVQLDGRTAQTASGPVVLRTKKRGYPGNQKDIVRDVSRRARRP